MRMNNKSGELDFLCGGGRRRRRVKTRAAAS